MAKLRLNDVTIEFGRSLSSAWRSHWPMHGPQALVITVPPIASRSSSNPSRSAVWRTCSDPGLIISLAFAFNPFALACRATLAARLRS